MHAKFHCCGTTPLVRLWTFQPTLVHSAFKLKLKLEWNIYNFCDYTYLTSSDMINMRIRTTPHHTGIRLVSQAWRRKDSQLISAGGRLNSENSPYRWNTRRVISQSALLLSAHAPGRAGHTQKRSRPITVKLQIDREVVWVRGRSQLTDSPVFHASVAVCENGLLVCHDEWFYGSGPSGELSWWGVVLGLWSRWAMVGIYFYSVGSCRRTINMMGQQSCRHNNLLWTVFKMREGLSFLKD